MSNGGRTLAYFSPMFHFYTSRLKYLAFWFLGGIEMDHWTKMGLHEIQHVPRKVTDRPNDQNLKSIQYMRLL